MPSATPGSEPSASENTLLQQGYHLSYCTNIHPGESWAEVEQSLKQYVPEVKKQVSPHKAFGLGLRLSHQASLELLEGAKLQEFKAWLDREGLYVFTLNGFPYGGFHHRVVKDGVHQPDWTTPERLHYTLRLFHILAVLLPAGVEGGISTSPLSYKLWHSSGAEQQRVFTTATEQLLQVVVHLHLLRQNTGKWLHLDIEPEPDGVLENTREVITYFREWLLPMGIPYLQRQLGLSPQQATAAIKDHLQLCYDVCHFALAYEEPGEVFRQLESEGIRIGKIQISAALKSLLPESRQERQQLAERYKPFAESTYLHQVVARQANGSLHQYNDLPAALQDIQNPALQEWRTHFHVPVFESSYGSLQSTQDDIRQVLEIQQEKPVTSHLEVETYTWEVLPPESRLPLTESIVRELEWVQQVLQAPQKPVK
ncbi:metabolite traffic protein EboE [Cesiribacter sp. SM1]|uniref:metabolite traffic protein EboE n=1 Tax=Cesiribacter sp. SM1 TaxID=2861196 RepID=UPI001CD6E55C|nr:metabolite traffic protein EboE [Cesiribacter sp. SM1]